MQSLDAPVSVLVVADDALARAGLAALLADQPGCNVVGQVAGSDYASVDPDVYRADVAVWDLGWDADHALEHLAESLDTGPPAVVLVPDESHSAQARTAGARGILLRDVDVEVLVAAIRAVWSGLAVLQPELEPQPPSRTQRDAFPARVELTTREREVLGLMAEGLPNKAIALRLEISEHTVKFHVNAILSKLGAQSRTEAVTRATRMGLILL